jgi:hypothetical protein
MLTPGCPFGLCRRLPERGCLVRHGHQVSGSFIDTYGSVGFQQGSLTEGEGSVRLTSLYYLVQISCFYIENIITLPQLPSFPIKMSQQVKDSLSREALLKGKAQYG